LRLGVGSGDETYGPIEPVTDLASRLPLLQLLRGFRYTSYGWTGDPMADGAACPRSHGGMGVVRVRRHRRRGREVLPSGRRHPAWQIAAEVPRCSIIRLSRLIATYLRGCREAVRRPR